MTLTAEIRFLMFSSVFLATLVSASRFLWLKCVANSTAAVLAASNCSRRLGDVAILALPLARD
jgi:hypothetical protein